MFSWPLRIAGWIIGIYAILKLAAATGAVTYTQVFQAWMDQLRDVLDLGFILKPFAQAVILPALDYIRSFGITIPALQDHWQQVFVLTWLLSAAWARNTQLVQGYSAQIVAVLCVMPLCVAAGTTDVRSVAVLCWPLAGFFLLLSYISTLSSRRDWLASFLSLAAFSGLAVTGKVFGHIGAHPLLALVLVVVLMGILFLIGGLLTPASFEVRDRRLSVWEDLRRRFQSPGAAAGLDITAAMLGAFGLATAFADPPLF